MPSKAKISLKEISWKTIIVILCEKAFTVVGSYVSEKKTIIDCFISYMAVRTLIKAKRH